MDKYGKYIKRIPSPDANRTTIFTTFNYAFQNYYSNDFNYIPNPVINSDYNCYIRFDSETPGEVIVDWGDGNIETFKMRKYGTNAYIAAWRTLNVDYRKNPSSTGGGWGLGIDQNTGEYIRPYPNHHYADDDINGERVIRMTFTCDIIRAYFNTTVHHNFPILEMTNLKQLQLTDNKYINEIPYSRITKLKNLTYLNFNRLGGTLQYIPDSIFDMTGLTSLTLAGVVNLSNLDSSNIRKISNLKKLTTLDLNTTQIPQYIKEFNDLPNLVSLNIAPNVNSDTPTQDRADTFVNNFYNYVTGWTQITMSSIAKDGKRNQLYGLYVNLYSASEPQNNTRPSGVEQAPSGFVKGSNNGNPTTPMEKIYVLKNNYAQAWNVKPT